jgi:hypothetical protein
VSAGKKPPWVRPTGGPVPYVAVRDPVDTCRWDDFGKYYLQQRGAAAAHARRVVNELQGTLPPGKLKDLFAALLKTRTRKDLTGQLGEIVGSFVLNAGHGALLCGLSWPVTPFDVRRGVDISGVCTESWLVLCVESKATETDDVRSQVTKARNGLKAADLWDRFSLDLDDGHSRRAVVCEVRRALRAGRLKGKSLGPGDVEKLVSREAFVRVGVIVHSTANHFCYARALEWLEKDDLARRGETATSDAERREKRQLPTVFIDVQLDDFQRALDGWVELEKWLEEGVI